jgi:hypothetical protein
VFLCDTCHDKANCVFAFDALGSRSRGQCESCHQTAACIDCHGYGKGKPARWIKNAAPYATRGTISKMEPAHGAYQAGEIGTIRGDDGRQYQFGGFGAKTGPDYKRTIFAVGDRVSFELLHVGGVGYLKTPLATGLKRLV